MSYAVRVNDVFINEFSVSSGDSHAIHEGFDPAILTAGQNKVMFKLTADSGAVQFSDVYMLFRQTT